MGGFPSHPDPDVALFTSFDVAEADVPDEDEDRDDGKLNVGQIPQPSDES
jgi:hypothetical protein